MAGTSRQDHDHQHDRDDPDARGVRPQLYCRRTDRSGAREGMAGATTAARVRSRPFVIEADEYDRMFLGLRLEIAVVTNVEWGSRGLLPDPATFVDVFRPFVGQLPGRGLLRPAPTMSERWRLRDARQPWCLIRTYGLPPRPIGRRVNCVPTPEAGWMPRSGRTACRSRPLQPEHTRAATMCATHWPPRDRPLARHQADVGRCAMLHDFSGAGRRFEVIGEAGERDDHRRLCPPPHRGRRNAVRQRVQCAIRRRRIWAVFQPTPTAARRRCCSDFAHSFDDADQVIFLDIYRRREKIDLGMHSRLLLSAVHHPGAWYIGAILMMPRPTCWHMWRWTTSLSP